MKRIVGLAVMLAGGLSLAQAAEAIDNRPPREMRAVGGGGGTILDGTMNTQVVNGCFALITGTVHTPNTGVDVSAAINFWDDGNFLGGTSLAFPGDGGAHSYCDVHQQLLPVGQAAPGLGVFLEDAIGLAATTTFATVDPLDISNICTGEAPVCVSSPLEVPAIDRTGFLLLALLLAAAAVVWLARRRTASAGR